MFFNGVPFLEALKGRHQWYSPTTAWIAPRWGLCQSRIHTQGVALRL
jgi:hypothetical protein